MNINVRETLRWIAIVVCGGFAVWISVTSGYHIITQTSGDWADKMRSLVGFGFVALFTAPFYVVAYICFRRQYRELFSVLGVVGAIVVFGVLISLQRHWHVQEFLDRHMESTPWLAIFGLPISLLCLFGPFYAAAWVFRVCLQLARRTTPG